MFDLEQAIAGWRRQMLAAGIKSPVPLEELEMHLREGIARQMHAGTRSQEAFKISIRQIGPPEPLEHEFKKIRKMPVKQTIKIVVILLMSVVLQIPGSFQLRDELTMTVGNLGLWLSGLVLQMWAAESLWHVIRLKLTGRQPGKLELSIPKLTLKTGAGIGVLLSGIALMLPAGAQACREGMVNFDALCWLVLGLALFMAGAVVTCCPFKTRKTKYV